MQHGSWFLTPAITTGTVLVGKLFADGVQPNVVVLLLSPRQLDRFTNSRGQLGVYHVSDTRRLPSGERLAAL